MTLPNEPLKEPVWKFRGYELRPSEFTTAMVHYYRAEIQRSNTWRNRLDATTNWAVISTGATLSFALSSPDNHFGVIILNTLLVTLFLWIEARRYRYYELWSLRARLVETDFFAAMLVPPFSPHAEWAESLADSLLNPEFPITMLEAIGRRLRRNYMFIYLILGLAWMMKIYLHPFPASSWEQFVSRAALGSISGQTVFMAGVIFTGFMALLALFTIRLSQTSGEVLPKFDFADVEGDTTPLKNRFPQLRKRRQLLVWIITDKPAEIGKTILARMARGVTAMSGTGMYTNQPHTILMVAVTTTEVAELKTIVQSADPNAFVVVNPARDIFGKGFQELKDEESA
jgi:uncharacterized membrane protein